MGIRINEEDGKIECNSTCKFEEFITPGTPTDRGICNANCGELPKANNNNWKCPMPVMSMKCGDKKRIGYSFIT